MKLALLKYSALNSVLNFIGLIILCLVCISYILRSINISYAYGTSDFFSFYQSMRFYFSGQDIYSPIIKLSTTLHQYITVAGNLNPPFLTVLLLPLYYFNYAQALELWTIISLIALILSSTLMLKPYPRCCQYSFFIIILCSLYTPNSIAFTFGQLSQIILLLIVSAWICARKEKEICAGILIGLALSLKLFCGLFLIYFLCLKRYRALISALLTFGISLISSGIILGFRHYISYYHTLSHISWYAQTFNYSIKGFFFRLFIPSENNYVLIALPHLGNFLIIFFCLLLLSWLICFWLNLQTFNSSLSSEKKAEQILYLTDIGFSAAIIGMLLLSPLGWLYYFNLLAIPYLVIINNYKNDSIHLICAGLLCLSTLSGDLIKTYNIKNFTQILYNGGIGFYILLILLGLLAGLVRHLRPSLNALNKPALNKLIRVNHKKNKTVFINKNLWIIIYFLIFIPTIDSQFKIFQQLGDAISQY